MKELFPPNNWEIEAGAQWIKTTDAGGYGASASSMLFDNYSISQVGTRANIQTGVDLTNYTASNCFLSFDVAYAKYAQNYTDSLEVLVSTDCGVTWTSVYFKGGDDLATAPDETGTFIPANSEWRTDSIDLGSYAGINGVSIRFSNINDYGQRLYIDNVNLSSGTIVSIPTIEETTIDFYPNPATPKGSITVSDGTVGTPIWFRLYDMQGKYIGAKRMQSGERVSLSEWNLTSGAYMLVLQNNKKIISSKLIIAGKR